MTANLRGVPRVPGEAPSVVLYTRRDCHLCEVARALLLSLQRTIPFHLAPRDIEGDEGLERRFLLEIPVVEVDGQVVSSGGQVDLEAVRTAVNHARIAAARRTATGEG